MIELKINNQPYNLRTNWNEVTMRQYCDIVRAKDKPVMERLLIYSQLPIEVPNVATLAQITLIAEILEFMDTPETIEAFAVSYESDFKIGEAEYWKIEKAKQLLKTVSNPILASAEIVELYTGDSTEGKGGQQISDKPVTEVIGQALFFCNVSGGSLSGSSG